MSRWRLFRSLRSRILAVVIVGAVIPLALIGWWLSRSAAQSGERRLRAQLDSTLVGVITAMEARWQFRDADLQLLSGNEAVRRMVAQTEPTLSAGDSAFLYSLESDLRPSVSSAVIRDRAGRVWWTFGSPAARDGAGATVRRDVAYAEPGVDVARPVRGEKGDTVGEMVATVRLAAMLPLDSIPHILAGVALSVFEGETGRRISGSPHHAGEQWVSARRAVREPALTLEMSVPSSAYLEPFERATEVGLLALAAVAVVAIGLSAYLAGRVTRSLEQLGEAAEAVARGDLSRTAGGAGEHDDVARLASAFNAMTESLRTTLDRLAQKESLAAVGEFATSLSHETRNALTSVSVDLQRATETFDEPAVSRELLERARGNVRRLDAIVTGALRLARSGHMPNETVNVHASLASAVQLAEPVVAAAVVMDVLVPSGSDSTINVAGDRGALEQLFVNVLMNAGQAIAGTGRIGVQLGATEADVVVTIADNGRGMSARDLERVGEPFFSARAGGNGLGVAIARRIATAHGGNLTIISAEGEGTTVTITLPRAHQERSPLWPRS